MRQNQSDERESVAVLGNRYWGGPCCWAGSKV